MSKLAKTQVSAEARREVTAYIDDAIAELHGIPSEWFDLAELHALASDAAETGSPELLELIRRRAKDLVAAHKRLSGIVLVAKHVKRAAAGGR